MAQKNSFYAVPVGRKIGIFKTWEETKQSVDGFSGAKFKKFTNQEEAENFFKTYAKVNTPPSQALNKNPLAKVNTSPLPSQALNNDYPNPNKSPPMTKKLMTDIERQQYKKIIDIYCDGSVPGNGMNASQGGIGIVFGDEEFSEVVPKGKYGEKMTNNIAELFALKRVFEMIKEKKQNDETLYQVFSDSEYSINSITVWSKKLEKDKGGIKNKGLIVEVFSLYKQVENFVKLEHVRGHSFSIGNNRADELARMASEKNNFGFKKEGKRYGDNFFQKFEPGFSKKQKY